MFSGSSNQPLAQNIADWLKISLSSSETVHFADGEVRVRILTEVKDESVVVLQSLSQPGDSNLMELCQFGEIAKRSGAKKIIGVIPYLAYARQHKAHREGEAVSAKLVAAFLKAAGFSDCLLLDLHEEEVLNYFKIPTLHLSAIDTFAKFIDRHRDDFGGDDLIIIAPDKGRKTQAQNLAGILEVDYALIEKDRPLDQTDQISSNKMKGEIKNKEAIIFDDMISTGQTAIIAAQACLKSGAVQVNLMATHGVFSNADGSFWEKSPLKKVFVSDSILIPENKRFPKLEIVSLAPLIAKQLQNLV